MSIWKIGEANALSILKEYLDNKVLRYSTDRNDPDLRGNQ